MRLSTKACLIVLAAYAAAAETVVPHGVPNASCEMRRWLDPPRRYLDFERKVVRISQQETPDYDIECYEQANGPGTRQRVMMVIPKGASGSERLPAVVIPYYFVEGTIGREFDGTPLPHYAGVAFADDLAKRGFVCITADAYHLTYLKSPKPRSDFGRWGEAAAAFNGDWPDWSGIGKLAFDTRLLVDVLASDPRVDPGRIGIMGHSLGGKMAFYAGCTDPRIRVIVASDWGAGWNSTNWSAPWYWGERKLAELKSAGVTHDDLYGLGGRKPFLLIAGHDDTEASREMFAREGDRNFTFLNHATGHRPPRDAVEAGYGFLESRLKERRKASDANTIRLEGEYPGHLQDVWIDGETIWWAHTQFLLKTGKDGHILRKAEVGGHHAGLEVRDGRLYTAVCAFNGEPRGATTPACHVMIGEYDAATLDRIEMHVLDINDRAGSLCILEDGSFLVGCLRHPALKPTEVKFHHIGRDYRLIGTHVVDVGLPVKLGIEVIRRYGNDVYLLIYGGPLMRIDAKTFAVTGRFKNVGGQMGFAKDGASVWTGFSRRKAEDDKASPWVSGLQNRPFALKLIDDTASGSR